MCTQEQQEKSARTGDSCLVDTLSIRNGMYSAPQQCCPVCRDWSTVGLKSWNLLRSAPAPCTSRQTNFRFPVRHGTVSQTMQDCLSISQDETQGNPQNCWQAAFKRKSPAATLSRKCAVKYAFALMAFCTCTPREQLSEVFTAAVMERRFAHGLAFRRSLLFSHPFPKKASATREKTGFETVETQKNGKGA